jgi:hypothetical protein
MINNRNIIFNGVNLESISGLYVTDLTNYTSAERNLSQYGIANADGLVVSGSYYGRKTIIVKGFLKYIL